MQFIVVHCRRSLSLACLVVAVLLGSPISGAKAADAGQLCEKSTAKALQKCVNGVNKAQLKCYQKTGVACPTSDAAVVKALAKASDRILKKCPDAATVVAAGYGPLMTPDALVDRVEASCLAETSSLASPNHCLRNRSNPTKRPQY